MKQITKLKEIDASGTYQLKDSNKWIEVKEQLNGKFVVFGPIGRNNEEMFLTVSGKMKEFSSIQSLVNHLLNCAKKNFWNMREWNIDRDVNLKRLVVSGAEVRSIENHMARVVHAQTQQSFFIRIGDCYSKGNTVVGDIGDVYYTKFPNGAWHIFCQTNI